MHCSVTSDHIIAEEVGTVNCEDELRPAVRTGGLESDVEREVPDDPGGRVEAPAADLADSLLGRRPCSRTSTSPTRSRRWR